MRKFFIGLVVGLILLPVGGYLFLVSGGMPVATEGPPLPLEKTIAGIALHHAIGAAADRPAPFEPSESHYLAGAKNYRVQCAVCHGLIGQPASGIAKGLFPKPPTLLPPKKGVTDDPVGETFWKARNGIRLTGMPGFVNTLTEMELWEVSLLLANADKLPASVREQLSKPPETR